MDDIIKSVHPHHLITAPAGSIVQRMPGSRVRLDPTVIRDIACWLMCQSMRWASEASQTLRGFKGEQRTAAKERIKYARYCLSATQQLIDRLTETVSLKSFQIAMVEFNNALDGLEEAEKSVTGDESQPEIAG